MKYFTFLTLKFLKSVCILTTNTSQFGLATFQVLSSHMWLAAPIINIERRAWGLRLSQWDSGRCYHKALALRATVKAIWPRPLVLQMRRPEGQGGSATWPRPSKHFVEESLDQILSLLLNLSFFWTLWKYVAFAVDAKMPKYSEVQGNN